MNSRRRLLLVGAGNMGQKHLHRLRESADFTLQGVCDTSRTALPSDLPGWCSLEEALSHARPDAVLIATPPPTHVSCARICLEAGLPVLLEKPLAPSYAQAQELVQDFKRQGVLLEAALVERFNPAWLQLCAALAKEPARHLHIRRQGGRYRPEHGIGVGLDLAIHDLDLSLALFPNLRSTRSSVPDSEAPEEQLSLCLEQGDVTVELSAAWNAPPQRTWEIETRRGTLRADLAALTTGKDALVSLHAAFAQRLKIGIPDSTGLARALAALALLPSREAPPPQSRP